MATAERHHVSHSPSDECVALQPVSNRPAPSSEAPAPGPQNSVALDVRPRTPTERQVVVVRLCGEHDLASAGEVRTRLAEARATGLTVVDLSECAFLDSSIMACLIAVRRAQGFLAVALPPASTAVERTLTITGVTEILSCHRTVREAIDAALAATA